MGQKVNPLGLRIGINRNWTAHWFNKKDASTLLKEDFAIRQVIEKRFHHSGIAKVDVYRNRGDIVVSIHTSKPGIVIGRSGTGAQELRTKLDRAIKVARGNFEEKVNLRLNIIEVRAAELDAKLVAETIANQIERRISVKRALKLALERTMDRGAKGIKIKISGRLNGAEIARSESAAQGSIPLQTLKSSISYAQGKAVTTYGVIGIKVWIYLGESMDLPIDSAPEQQSNSRSNKRSDRHDRRDRGDRNR